MVEQSDKMYDLATQQAAIAGRFAKDYEFTLQWLPHYVEEFPNAVRDVQLSWEKCKFVTGSQGMVPDKHGVYCFSIKLGSPFPKELHVPLYIGKAAPGYLSERFKSYFSQRVDVNARTKVVFMLNRYHNKLFFWWAELPRVHVDMIEEHLLMCCKPPCNELVPKRSRLWSKAFD